MVNGNVLKYIRTVRDYRVHTYIITTTGTQAVVDLKYPKSQLSIQVKQTGNVSSWNIQLEGSLDGVNFDSILVHTKGGDGDAGIEFVGQNISPILYMRMNVTALTLGAGTNVIATILAVN